MTEDIRKLLKIDPQKLEEINVLLLDPSTEIIQQFLEVVNKYGTPSEINQKAKEAASLPHLIDLVRQRCPHYLDDLKWLEEQRDRKAFVNIKEYRRKILGDRADQMSFAEDCAVTLEISATQYFPWVITIAKKAIEEKSLMPARYIRVRKMREQEEDGDLVAMAAAMQIIGASYVESLDTKGTDGSNIHLGGAETITGYFGGVGQPNDYALKWLMNTFTTTRIMASAKS